MKTREKILKLLKKRGIAVNDSILEALDAFLFEVQEQVPGAPGDDDDEESAHDGEEDDEDDDLEEEDEDEEEEDAKVERDVLPGADLGIDAQEDDELFGGAVSKGGRGKAASAKKAPKDPALDSDGDEDEEGEPERTLIRQVTCPHCGESMPVVLDLSGGDQDDIQDCEVCCSPMRITYTVSQGTLRDFSVEAS